MEENSKRLICDETTFVAMMASFQEAGKKLGGVAHDAHLAIFGGTVRVRIVGRCLAAEIMPALVHLQSDVAREDFADMTIDLWDEEESGVPAPVEASGSDLGPLGVVHSSPDGRYITEERDHSLNFLDRRRQRIAGCTRSPSRLCLDERARPLHRLLSVWLDGRGIQFLHSGLAAIDGDGVLFVGNSGAGKTTCSIACLCGGFTFLSDDFVGLEENRDGSFTGHGPYASCLVDTNHLKLFPVLSPLGLPANHDFEDKRLIFLADAFPGRVKPSVSVRAIALPHQVESNETTIRPASKMEALRALAPSSIMARLVKRRASLDGLTRLVERVPAYWIELGNDVDQIPGLVERMLGHVHASTSH